MKLIFKNFKDAIIVTVVVIGVFIFVYSFGFPAMKQGIENSRVERDYSTYQDSTTYIAIAERQAPSITYDNSKRWKKNTEIPISQVFLTEDADGNELEIKVLGIKDMAGNVVTGNYDETEKKVLFNSAGNYFFELRVIDCEKKVTTETIQMVVDN